MRNYFISFQCGWAMWSPIAAIQVITFGFSMIETNENNLLTQDSVHHSVGPLCNVWRTTYNHPIETLANFVYVQCM